MEYIFNALLFCYYMIERGTYRLIIKCFAPILKVYLKFTYNLDPFHCIQNKYNSADKFIKDKFRVGNEADSNLDYGYSMTRSEGSLIIVCAPYIQYVLIFVERIIYRQRIIDPVTFFWIALLISGVINYFFCFRNDKYLLYFKILNNKGHKWIWISLSIMFAFISIILAVLSLKL